MSFQVTVSGHRDFETEDEARAYEQDVCEKARAFVASLDGVTWAQSTFGLIGSQNLTASA